MGVSDPNPCENCGKKFGTKLDEGSLEALIVEFFWNGSFLRSDFGGANRLASNPSRFGENEVKFPYWLENDALLIQDKLRVGLFHYGPQLWRIGEIEPLIELRDPVTRSSGVSRVLDLYPAKFTYSDFEFYRLRREMADGQELSPGQYDSPPSGLVGRGRLDAVDLPVLYGSTELEVCFHECRVTIPDE